MEFEIGSEIESGIGSLLEIALYSMLFVITKFLTLSLLTHVDSLVVMVDNPEWV